MNRITSKREVVIETSMTSDPELQGMLQEIKSMIMEVQLETQKLSAKRVNVRPSREIQT